MLKLGTCLLWALAAWSLGKGSFAEDSMVCLLDDPNPNECDSFCLKALRPMLINTKAKLDGLEGRQVKMEGQLQSVQTAVEAIQAKLAENLHTVQSGLEGQQAVLTKIEAQLQAVIKKINANQPTNPPVQDGILKPVTNKRPSVFQQTQEVIPNRIINQIPWGFQT